MKRRNFSPEFKRESAQLVVDQNYTVFDAAEGYESWPFHDDEMGQTTAC